jgi:hypothetical protein
LLALALLLPLGGCPLLQIEAEMPEVCITRTGVTVPGSLGQVQTTVSVSLEDVDGLDELKGGDELRFLSFSARPQSGGDELAGLRSAAVALRTGEASLPALPLFSCAGDCATAEGALTLAAATDENVAAHLNASGAAVEVELEGSLPPRDFKIDVSACLAGEISRSL